MLSTRDWLMKERFVVSALELIGWMPPACWMLVIACVFDAFAWRALAPQVLFLLLIATHCSSTRHIRSSLFCARILLFVC